MRKYLLFMMLFLSMITRAQFSFDVTSVEAYINDHKQQRSLLLARSTLESGNALLHEYSADATHDYKELNMDLDKYTRAFDVIDVIYQSVRTGMNVYSTYNTVSDRIGDYKKMLGDYNDKVLKRGKFEVSDTIILTINLHLIDKVADEGKELYKSVSEVALYVTGAAACSTSDLILLLESINTNLDNIEVHLNKAYFETWRYIQLRMGYWKSEIYNSQTKQQIAKDAFGRWRKSTYDALHKNRNNK